MSQRKLAEKSQVSLRSIQYYERNGKKPRSLQIYQILAEALEIDAEDLMDDHDRFRVKVAKMYGPRGVWQLRKLLEGYKMRLDEGVITEDQYNFMMTTYQEVFLIAKQKMHKHARRSCRPSHNTRDRRPDGISKQDGINGAS